MSRFNLRLKQRISYYEPEEPNFDEYVYCDKCMDYVYEYCSIHGPLLVIPDDKVPAESRYPSYVPRAALTIPNVFLHLAPSIIPGAGLGVFTTLTLPQGVRFGPFVGQHTLHSNSYYCWQIYDKNNKPSHVVCAADPGKSNWMRYVNCARHWQEQNLVAFQYQGKLYYRTVKIVPKFSELMVFYGSEYANALRVDLRRYNCRQNENVQRLTSNTETKTQPNTSQKEKFNTVDEDIQDIKTSELDTTCIDKENNNVPNNNNCISEYEKRATVNERASDSVYECHYCGEKFTIKAMLCLHIKYHLDNNKATNLDVNNGSKVAGLSNVQKIDNLDIEYKHKCQDCKYGTNKFAKLKRHVRTHTGEKPYLCTFCEFKCSESSSLKMHIRKHTGEKPFSCKVCEYKCSESSTLKRHIRTHTGEKPFSCTFCEYKCSESSTLKSHIRTHTGEKPFSCTFCEFKCNKNSTLKCHIRTHTREKPFSCTFCEFKCNKNSTLKCHIRTHTREKPFSCTFCEFKCSQSSNLERHIRTHTGEKPFSCKVCEFKCSESSTLKRHIRTHTGEKPFSCTFCEYKCSGSYKLKMHIRTHTGEKPFTCNVCEYKCTNRSSLRRHTKIHSNK